VIQILIIYYNKWSYIVCQECYSVIKGNDVTFHRSAMRMYCAYRKNMIEK